MEEKSPYEPILVNYGGAKKSVFEMNAEEFEEAAKNITRRAKEKAFSKGLPIYISIDGQVYAEYVDGRIELVPNESSFWSQPILYIIAGANGTGKTTATFDLVPPGIPVINSDEIAKQLKTSVSTNINLQELGNREALHLTESYLNSRQTFGIETNLADVETWKFLVAVKKTGYLLHLIFLCTDDLNLLNNRIKERTLRGEHFIRQDIVAERHLNGLQLLKHYLKSPDRIQFIDSSKRNYLIAEMQSNQIELKTDKIPAWFQNYIISGVQNNTEQRTSAKDADSIETVRLHYQKLKINVNSY